MPKKTLRAQCLTEIQKLARISAANSNGYAQCVSCDPKDMGGWHHWKDGDGGHFIPKGSSSYWALEICNVHFQCKGCNGFGMKHGSAEAWYTLWMQDFYGHDFVEKMLRDKGKEKKLYAADYREMLANFKALIKHHEERIAMAFSESDDEYESV
jgi:hypothetical protein